jgi:hypothetical protein
MDIPFFGHPFAGIYLLFCGLMMFFCLGFQRRNYFWLRFILSLGVFFTASWFFPNINLWYWLMPGFLVAFFSMEAVVLISFQVTVKEATYYAMAVYLLQNGCSCLVSVITGLITNSDPLRGEKGILVTDAVAICMMALLYFAYVRKAQRQGKVIIDSGRILVLSCLSVCFCFVLSSLASLAKMDNVGQIIYYAVLGSADFLIFFIQFGLLEKSRLEEDKNVLTNMLQKEKERATLSKENIDLINQKCHDLKHQIGALKTIDNKKQHDENVEEIQKAIMIYDSVAHTGSEALDVVLSEKSLFCSKHSIRLSYLADGSKLSFLSNSDIYSLFGNLLDNAIEAVMHIDDPEKRIVNFHVLTQGQILSVHMDNYYEGTIAYEESLPKTTKGDKDYHGFGLKSIKYITEKNNGHMTVKTADQVFSVDLIFDIKEPKPQEKTPAASAQA